MLTFRTENNQNLFENMHGWIRVYSIYFQKKLSRSNANARDQLSGTESCANVIVDKVDKVSLVDIVNIAHIVDIVDIVDIVNTVDTVDIVDTIEIVDTK